MNTTNTALYYMLEDGITPAIELKNYLHFSKILVETGTCFGEGVHRALLAGFTDVRSVEMVEDRYHHCKNRFEKDSRVSLWNSDSRKVLFEMLPDRPCVVFLDAHPSGEGSGGHDDLIENGKSSIYLQDRILVDEINIILSSPHQHIIIIDDTSTVDPLYTTLLPNYTFRIIANKFLECIPNQ